MTRPRRHPAGNHGTVRQPLEAGTGFFVLPVEKPEHHSGLGGLGGGLGRGGLG